MYDEWLYCAIFIDLLEQVKCYGDLECRYTFTYAWWSNSLASELTQCSSSYTENCKEDIIEVKDDNVVMNDGCCITDFIVLMDIKYDTQDYLFNNRNISDVDFVINKA